MQKNSVYLKYFYFENFNKYFVQVFNALLENENRHNLGLTVLQFHLTSQLGLQYIYAKLN